MSYAYPQSGLSTEALIKIADSDYAVADELDAVLAGGQNQASGLTFDFTDHWLLGAQLAQGNGWNGAAIGAAPYSLNLTGANSAITPVTGTGRIGVVTLDTGTTNTGQAAIFTAASISNVSGKTARQSYEWVGGFDTLSTVGEEYLAEIGLIGNAPGYGVYFEYDRGNVKGANPSNLDCWQVCTMEAGVATRTLLPASVIAALVNPETNYYRLKAVLDYDTGEGYFYINDVLVATHTTNVPTHSMAGSAGITKSAGTTPRKLTMDYTNFHIELNTAMEP